MKPDVSTDTFWTTRIVSHNNNKHTKSARKFPDFANFQISNISRRKNNSSRFPGYPGVLDTLFNFTSAFFSASHILIRYFTCVLLSSHSCALSSISWTDCRSSSSYVTWQTSSIWFTIHGWLHSQTPAVTMPHRLATRALSCVSRGFTSHPTHDRSLQRQDGLWLVRIRFNRSHY